RGTPAGGPEPLVDRTVGRMAAVEAEARGRGGLRPLHRRSLPPRHETDPLAPRQGARAVHPGSGEAEESEPDEAAGCRREVGQAEQRFLSAINSVACR